MMEHYTSFEEFKKIELNILRYIKQVCAKENIQFYLGYGTVIGAVRHQGYIPWDDDIDVVFERKEYIKFKHAVIADKHPYYRLLDIDIDKKFDYPFPKIKDMRTSMVRDSYRSPVDIGVYIDILVLDKVPDDLKLREKLYKKLRFYTLLWSFSIRKTPLKYKNFIKTAVMAGIRLIPPRFLVERLNKLAQTYQSGNYEECRVMMIYHANEAVMPISMYGAGKMAMFEGEEYPIPEKYDEYLTKIYGDYMKLPPEEKRIAKHANKALILDEKALED